MQGSAMYAKFFLKAHEKGRIVVPFTGDKKEQQRQARNLRYQLYKFRRRERENPDSLIAEFANEISFSIKKTADGFVLVATKERPEPEYQATLSKVLEDSNGD